MKLIKLIWLLPLSLSGCDKGPNLGEICSQNPKICTEFKENNHCNNERNATIFAQANLKATGKDIQKYHLLMNYENYANCLTIASQAKNLTSIKEKTTLSTNLSKATARIKVLSDETINTDNPDLLYYHWSQNSDQKSLAKFLSMEGGSVLETPSSQLHLAIYYSNINPTKTIALLLHALELNQADKPIDPEIFKLLVSIYTKEKKYKQAYIWLKALNTYKPLLQKTNNIKLKQLSAHFKTSTKFLDKLALLALDKAVHGFFKAPKR